MDPSRDGLGAALCALPPTSRPWVVTADLVGPLGLADYWELAPERCVNTGVAEQLMVAVAAGLASDGQPAICCTFASFMLRATEQLRSFLCIDAFPVLAIGSHAGLSAGPNGVSHHALDDLAVLAGIGLECWSPMCAVDTAELITHFVEEPRPRYMRLSKWAPGSQPSALPSVEPASSLRLGQPDLPVIVAHGTATLLALGAAEILAADGIDVGVIHVSRIHPLPVDELQDLVTARRVVVAEDHFARGGLTDLIRLHRVGIGPVVPFCPITFHGSDEADVLYENAGLTAAQIASGLLVTLETGS